MSLDSRIFDYNVDAELEIKDLEPRIHDEIAASHTENKIDVYLKLSDALHYAKDGNVSEMESCVKKVLEGIVDGVGGLKVVDYIAKIKVVGYTKAAIKALTKTALSKDPDSIAKAFIQAKVYANKVGIDLTSQPFSVKESENNFVSIIEIPFYRTGQ